MDFNSWSAWKAQQGAGAFGWPLGAHQLQGPSTEVKPSPSQLTFCIYYQNLMENRYTAIYTTAGGCAANSGFGIKPSGPAAIHPSLPVAAHSLPGWLPLHVLQQPGLTRGRGCSLLSLSLSHGGPQPSQTCHSCLPTSPKPPTQLLCPRAPQGSGSWPWRAVELGWGWEWSMGQLSLLLGLLQLPAPQGPWAVPSAP